MNRCLWVLLALGLAACGGDEDTGATDSQDLPPGWRNSDTIDVDDTRRTYALYAPETEAFSGLVIALHGSGGTAGGMIAQLAAEPIADSHGFLLAVPQGLNNGWNDEDPVGDGLADDVGFIDALIAQLQTTYPSIPAHKIFAYGFSNGGGLATRLACESSLVRGIGVIGNYHASGLCTARPTERSIPGWFGAGVMDGLVPISTVRSSMSSFVSDVTGCMSAGELATVDVADAPDGVVCRELSGCNQARLCEYADYGHEALPGSLVAMWTYLSAVVTQ